MAEIISLEKVEKDLKGLYLSYEAIQFIYLSLNGKYEEAIEYKRIYDDNQNKMRQEMRSKVLEVKHFRKEANILKQDLIRETSLKQNFIKQLDECRGQLSQYARNLENFKKKIREELLSKHFN